MGFFIGLGLGILIGLGLAVLFLALGAAYALTEIESDKG